MVNKIYESIKRSCGYVTVVLNGEKISQGTCFSYTPDGEIITAAHVVTGRMPIRLEDYSDPNAKIFVKFPGRPVIEYFVIFCSVGINVDAFSEIIQLDIAVLAPKEKQTIPFSYLPARLSPPRLGDRVFLSGFSDDLSLPFNFDRIAKRDFPGMQDFLSAMQTGYIADMMGPMTKSAIVGNHVRIQASNSEQKISVDFSLFYLDNGVNSGASGGPIVNEAGEAIGVISQRAVTSASQSTDTSLKVPAGATIGLSLEPIETVRQIKLQQALTKI
ncbi:serine protease [Pseudomonas sp. MUP55]|uniref:S1 family peptidase n=1 Tax=Pseudomonas sp. MUP55 TaxID=3087234 RepID=UPI002A59F33D|nr:MULTISPECIES: serine protease [unclassified Pseudomonas]WPN95108.1 serine protease [Pseudomonas sp. MUP56]WPO00636.1 serine protease [Pseudomonas sp. MUP55]